MKWKAMPIEDATDRAWELRLDLDNWNYDRHFLGNPLPSANHPIIVEVEQLVVEAALDQHPFFKTARESRKALNLWISQEVVMTNAFSQIVLFAASTIENVHLRSVLCDVAYGEHGKIRAGRAQSSHPWLLHQLRESVGIPNAHIFPLDPTKKFIRRLERSLASPLEAIAAIGVGNERLIVPEYSAIKSAFEKLYPESIFKPFLDANLNEDIFHTKLCYLAASSAISSASDASFFLKCAQNSIESRLSYFDDLCVILKTID